MNDITFKIINLVYFFSAFAILKRLNLPIIRDSFLTDAWAGIFIASVFFTIGLLLFNIPFAFFGMGTPQATQSIKEIWWVAPVASSVGLIISLGLRTLILKIKKGSSF
jgi:hypothetical protein